MTDEILPIQAAIHAAGNAHRLAKAVGVSHVAVGAWLRRGKAPATRCIDIERLTGISRHTLRPDVFGQPPEPR